jgi:hypothetical protein
MNIIFFKNILMIINNIKIYKSNTIFDAKGGLDLLVRLYAQHIACSTITVTKIMNIIEICY